MSIAAAKQPLNIAVLAYPGCCIGDVIKLLEALHGLHARPCRGGHTHRPLATQVYSLDGAPLSSPFMPLFSVQTQAISDPLPEPLDTLIIAHGPEDAVRHLYRPLLGWLQRAQIKARRVVALGAGVFWLAAAGMPVRKVTTHTTLIGQLRLRYPKLDVQSASSLQIDGAFYTANEHMTANDLAETLLRDECNDMTGQQCTPQGQTLPRQGVTYQLCIWWLDKMDVALNMQISARQLNISERQLRRQVKEETGLSPALLLMLLRLEMARQALLDSGLPVDKVARRGGLRDGQQLARLFRKYLGQSPQQYRHGGAGEVRLHDDYRRLFDGQRQPGWLQHLVLEARAG